jgi:heavy metal translocating P-type ATPase
MEALVGIGAVSAYGYSVANLLQGSIHLYFDTACMLIILVQLGKLLEVRAKSLIQEDLGHYYTLMPAKVRLCSDTDDKGRYLAAEVLQAGDLFRVAEGETLPADGLVTQGRGLVDASSLTGEARPLPKTMGDRLVSGTRVVEGTFLVQAEKVGPDAMLGQMLRIMDGALSRKIALEGRTDRLLRVFVPVMVLLAAATALVLLMRGAALEAAFVRGLTVLVISCPCALGVAVPLARVAGVTLAARKGILVQEFAAFDLAQRIDTVVFDKTGTLTRGDWQLQTIVRLAPLPEETVLGVAAGIEQQVDHVIGVEIRRAAKASHIAPLFVSEVTSHEQGLSGRWDGQVVQLGSAAFVGAGPGKTPDREAAEAAHDMAVTSWIFLSVDDRIVARLGFGDGLKPSAEATVRCLRSRGLALRLVSGDSQNATQQVGDRLSLEHAQGDQRPLQKAHFVEALRREGAIVAMVGDGINDAPALAAADLSVAIFAGRQLGGEAQAVTLMQGDPLQLETFLAFAERVNRKIQQKLWGSLIYNGISIPIAMAGWLSPLVAVAAMLLSSLSVTGNTLLLVHGERRAAPSVGDGPRPLEGT